MLLFNCYIVVLCVRLAMIACCVRFVSVGICCFGVLVLALDWWLDLVCNCIDLLCVYWLCVWVGGLWSCFVVCWWMFAFWWFGWIVVACFLAIWVCLGGCNLLVSGVCFCLV